MESKRGTYTGYTAAHNEARKRYLAKFAEIKVRFTPEQRDDIKAHAQECGESVNTFLIRAALETMKRDKAIT